ncbi:MAG: glutathione S-transferase N-terminal domain-containing protein [Patescibacteria group bacterium]|nr:glutathione S-transferase N-terminal domain-containing protein [Patescibacteria group bacterium]MDE1946088.1 glutathione S-transferase N-terminal domain-containing protein [Patescibacteria group bacterium]
MAQTKKVTIYSTPTCHWCNTAKDFFKENKIAYESYDVGSDLARRKEMIQKSGQMGVPVIYVDNELVLGFDEDRLRQLLNIK